MLRSHNEADVLIGELGGTDQVAAVVDYADEGRPGGRGVTVQVAVVGDEEVDRDAVEVEAIQQVLECSSL